MSTPTPNTFLDRSPVLYVWRPLYKRVLSPVVLPLLSVVRGFVFAPSDHRTELLQIQIAQLQAELAEQKAKLDGIALQTAGVAAKIDATYLDSLGQWSAMEHLIVTTLRLADRAAAKRADALGQIERQQEALAPALQNLIQAVGDSQTQQRAISAQLSTETPDPQKIWREMETLIMSLLAQPAARATAAAGSRTAATD